ncbi:hypothetical protein KFK09_006115 [Dendrobium nobile]|uniref:Uncharacterized protein n=1 Tax=Dendrobium nobile TaxID=94219 RepID=A0A8T3BQS7_DENNO|nr:hypothetical protein KFK09_006115 [Dendrobium nobile]
MHTTRWESPIHALVAWWGVTAVLVRHCCSGTGTAEGPIHALVAWWDEILYGRGV